MHQPWWLRLGFNTPSPATGCTEPDCDVSLIGPVDVYCETHGRFLPGASGMSGTVQLVLINLCRVAVCFAFWLAAQLDADWPLLLTGLAVSATVLVLPLRRLSLERRTALFSWIAISLLVLIFAHVSEHLQRAAISWIAVLLLILSVLHLGHLAVAGGPHEVRQSADVNRPRPSAMPGVVAAAGAGSLAALVGYLLLAATAWWLIDLTALRALLLTIAVLGVVAAILVIVLFGLLNSGHRVNPAVDPLIRRPAAPPRLSWRLAQKRRPKGRGGDVLDQLARAFGVFLFRATQGLVAALRMSVQFILTLLHFVAVTLVAAVNWAHRLLVRLIRRLYAALLEALVLLGRAAAVGAASAPHTARVVLAPLGLLVLAAIGTTGWAAQSLTYAVIGSPTALAANAAAGIGAVALLTVVWALLSGQPRAVTAAAAERTLTIAGANALILLAVGGWVVGLLGSLGYGVIRVGWATIGATAVLVVAGIWSRLRRADS